jgi:hypothetical protein
LGRENRFDRVQESENHDEKAKIEEGRVTWKNGNELT